MRPTELSGEISVSAQIKASDLTELAKLGFKSVICNRPDGEGFFQPSFDDVARAAEALGLEVSYLPVISGAVSEKDAEDFGKIFEALPKPVIAYCKTGNRSSILWSLYQADKGSTTG